MKQRIACRGVITKGNQLLVVRLGKDDPYYCLPGGTLEMYENLHDCITREIQEELNFTPQIGKLICVHELVRDEQIHLVEFLYYIENSQDFSIEQTHTASHAHEISQITWIDISDETIVFHPIQLIQILKEGDKQIGGIQVISSV